MQTAHQRPAGGELHLVAPAVVRQDLFVFCVVADAPHQVVALDDERSQPKLLRAEGCRGSERTATHDEGVKHIGEFDR